MHHIKHTCDHAILSLKVIDSPVYCKEGQELCGTVCVGKGCTHSCVDIKSKEDDQGKNNADEARIEYVPSGKNYVMACMEVNACDYALCVKFSTKLFFGDDSGTDLGGGTLGSRRRSSCRRNNVKNMHIVFCKH